MSKKKGKRCPYCKGSGNEVQVGVGPRVLDTLVSTIEYKRCSYCQGTGHLNFEVK